MRRDRRQNDQPLSQGGLTMRFVNNPAKIRICKLRDFERHGLIGQEFGMLRLISVEYHPGTERKIEHVICRLTCANGHDQYASWQRLRDRTVKRECQACGVKAPKNHGSGSLSAHKILSKVQHLEPERQALFSYLLKSRKRAAGQDDTPFVELIRDVYEYAASPGIDPIEELKAWRQPDGRIETYYGSSTLAPSRLGYAEAD